MSRTIIMTAQGPNILPLEKDGFRYELSEDMPNPQSDRYHRFALKVAGTPGMAVSMVGELKGDPDFSGSRLFNELVSKGQLDAGAIVCDKGAMDADLYAKLGESVPYELDSDTGGSRHAVYFANRNDAQKAFDETLKVREEPFFEFDVYEDPDVPLAHLFANGLLQAQAEMAYHKDNLGYTPMEKKCALGMLEEMQDFMTDFNTKGTHAISFGDADRHYELLESIDIRDMKTHSFELRLENSPNDTFLEFDKRVESKSLADVFCEGIAEAEYRTLVEIRDLKAGNAPEGTVRGFEHMAEHLHKVSGGFPKMQLNPQAEKELNRDGEKKSASAYEKMLRARDKAENDGSNDVDREFE